MNRQAKIAQLKKAKGRNAPETLGEYAVLADAMEAIVAEFKQSLKRGVEISDLDVLLDRLEGIGDLKTSVDELKSAIKSFPALPEEVKIASVNEFLDAIKGIEIQAGDVIVSEKQQPDYSKSVLRLADAVENMAINIKASTPKPTSQRAVDYVPFRRVVKEGNTFKFDDSVQQGGSGGSTTPSRQDTQGNVYVPVGSADGEPIPVSVVGDVVITGDVIVDDVGVENASGTKINPATAERQDTGNGSLSSIDSKLSTTNTNTGATATNTGNIDTNLGAKADSAASSDTGTFSLIALFKRLLQSITTLNAKDFSTSAKQDTGNTSLGSIDTKLTSQATATKQDTGNTSLSSIDTKLTSQATAANQATELTRLGDVTETAPASDTASSGLNGRLQRIAQRLTSVIALLPGSLGQKARAASLAVTLSSEDITTLTPPAAITGFATSANQTTQITNQNEIIDELEAINSLTPSAYDYISLAYTGDNLTGVVFKSGGSGGSTVSTLTLAYTGDRLDAVTKT